jgi:putative ABC transport system permease protein
MRSSHDRHDAPSTGQSLGAGERPLEHGAVARDPAVLLRRGLPFVETTLQDLRYAVRSLARNPSFTAVAVVTLGVGIGASTTMFGIADAVLLRPLPYPEPGRLLQITETNPLKGWTRRRDPGELLDWRRSNTVFTDWRRTWRRRCSRPAGASRRRCRRSWHRDLLHVLGSCPGWDVPSPTTRPRGKDRVAI